MIALMMLAAALMPTQAVAAPKPAAVSVAVQSDLVPTPGTVTVEPMPENAGPAEVRTAFAEAVERALIDANFIALPGAVGQARYIARIAVSRRAQGEVASDAPVTGTATRVGNWGAGMTVTLPSAKSQLRTLVVTELTIELVSRAEDRVVWRGSALTAQVDGTPGDAPVAVVTTLVGAVMRGFPEVQEGAISVP
jgi:hypothetical protein